MIGKNEIKLCHAEMCEAMQQYIDSKFKQSPGKVTEVQSGEKTRDQWSKGPTDFAVSIEQRKPDPVFRHKTLSPAPPAPPAPPAGDPD